MHADISTTWGCSTRPCRIRSLKNSSSKRLRESLASPPAPRWRLWLKILQFPKTWFPSTTPRIKRIVKLLSSRVSSASHRAPGQSSSRRPSKLIIPYQWKRFTIASSITTKLTTTGKNSTCWTSTAARKWNSYLWRSWSFIRTLSRLAFWPAIIYKTRGLLETFKQDSKTFQLMSCTIIWSPSCGEREQSLQRKGRTWSGTCPKSR